LCWTEGLINISGLPFDELMEKFERAFDVKIDISLEKLPNIRNVSGKIRVNDGIDKALHILQYTADFSYKKNSETNVVTIY
jgi:transmembrane sensor